MNREVDALKIQIVRILIKKRHFNLQAAITCIVPPPSASFIKTF